jgi:tetratricopeptide (TPR) repeat protein
MSLPSDVRRVLRAWARRPSVAAASALKRTYATRASTLSLAVRAELCLALGEAAELEGHVDRARWLLAAAVSACDPERDERLYARAAGRTLLNGSRLGDVDLLGSIAAALDPGPGARTTSRAVCLARLADGLRRLLREDFDGARKAFEGAMSASWESHDADSEALAHHLLGQAWLRLGRVARAREHAEAAVRAARAAGSKALEWRFALELSMLRLRGGLSGRHLAEARKLLLEVRATRFPRFEALAWTKVARGVLADRLPITDGEGLLPDGHPDLGLVRRLGCGAAGQPALVRKSLGALAALAP